MDILIGIFCIAILLGAYILVNLFFTRYLGISLLFSTSHRGAKAINNERRSQKETVNKFASENPKIFREINDTLKRKRFAKTYENLDYLILQYVKKNPTWADDEYNKQMEKYAKEQSIKKNIAEEKRNIERRNNIELFISKGFPQEKAEMLANEFLSHEFDMPELLFFRPVKKTYP